MNILKTEDSQSVFKKINYMKKGTVEYFSSMLNSCFEKLNPEEANKNFKGSLNKRHTMINFSENNFKGRSNTLIMPQANKLAKLQIQKYKNLNEEYIKDVLGLNESNKLEQNLVEHRKNQSVPEALAIHNINSSKSQIFLKPFHNEIKKSINKVYSQSPTMNSYSTINSLKNTPLKLKLSNDVTPNLSKTKTITPFLGQEEKNEKITKSQSNKNDPDFSMNLSKKMTSNFRQTFNNLRTPVKSYNKREDYDLQPKERMKSLKKEILFGKDKVKDILGDLKKQQTQNQYKLKEFITNLKMKEIKKMKV